jgi:hypothetical protein
MRSRFLTALLLTGCCCCLSITASGGDSPLPTISELEKLTFVLGQVSANASSPYEDVSAARNLFLAYSAEEKAVSQYRDPMLTRGAQGEAIFRSVSPAVVAVVVGSVDGNGNFDPEGLGTGAIVDARGLIYKRTEPWGWVDLLSLFSHKI